MVLLDEEFEFRAVSAGRQETDAGLTGQHTGIGQMGFGLEGVGTGQRLIC
jgi:hypothetical protein